MNKGSRHSLLFLCGLTMLSHTGCGGATLATTADDQGVNDDPTAALSDGPDTLPLSEANAAGQNAAVAKDPGAQPGDSSAVSCTAGLAKGAFVACDARDRLVYRPDKSTGAYVLNYATTGYHGGGVALPTLAVSQTLRPSGKDDTSAIQAAIDAVQAKKADADGFRGRVLLAPGSFNVSRTLTVTQGGVVLEGTASVGPQATTLKLTGSATQLMSVSGKGGAVASGSTYTVTKVPVTAGTRTLTLNTTAGLKVGDDIQVASSRNLAWITMMWGGKYPPVRDGKTQSAWGSAMTARMARTITAIDGKVISLDAPISDTLPADKYAGPAGATVRLETTPGFVSEVGIGHLRLQGRYVAGTLGNSQLTGISFNAARDCWIDDVEATDFGFATVKTGGDTRNLTFQDMRMIRTGIQDGGAKPFDLNLYGQKILVQGCSSQGSKTFYATHNNVSSAGPNVVQNYRVDGSGTFEPHQRWSPGLLYDNVYIPKGGIALKDRAGAGSGHGWGTGFSVVHNSLAGTQSQDKAGMDALPGFTLGQPAQSMNLGMGLVGPDHSPTKSPTRFDSPGKPIGPPSLWAHQLWQSKGPTALQTVIGPWHVVTADNKACLAASDRKASARVDTVDCNKAGQLALFDVTSRGWVRLGDSGLCLDALNGDNGTSVVFKACNDTAMQRWDIPSRGGFATVLRLAGTKGNGSGCVVPSSKGAVMGPCNAAAGPWRMLVTTLAR